MSRRFKKVAIANRGEVAVRIIHACRELGLKTVLLHSEADEKSIAYRMADQRVCIGPAAPRESYLSIRNNIFAALSAGAEALHPGFGFLSENAEFAQACANNELLFIGPSPESIRLLGDKVESKGLAVRAQLPTVPGYDGAQQDLKVLREKALSMGLPVLVKAVAGGGGRGMKIIASEAAAIEQIESAQREAQSAFGSPVVFLEKYLDHAKHIEVQVFGDAQGQVHALFERECTVQRRHQKIIEEASSPSLTQALRVEMLASAVRLAQLAQYRNAGTVEFLLQDDKFYFLEMNTRLQVEHPVTEEILGVDLVKAQLLTAMGESLGWPAVWPAPSGHAIECRLYAEDSENQGLPSCGRLLGVRWPAGPGRRFDVGFGSLDEITPYYDPMIAKIIVKDETRARAIDKMLRVLDEVVVFGVKTNIGYLKAILQHPEFRSGTMTTQFIDRYFSHSLSPAPLSSLQNKVVLAAQKFERETGQFGAGENPWLHSWSKA